jgi:nucleotide-binding universal stress UspA family protein/uncharacterized membrane protein YfcA
VEIVTNFIPLNALDVTYLLVVGFIGGLVSGFIGSGGAFVLTPAMMSMGVPGIVAVASNICHKFPKALVGAIKRAKYGQVDVKLGVVLGVSAEAGVLYGAHIQEDIKRTFGDAGSNLYVSVAFVVVLAIVGTYVLWDAWRLHRTGRTEEEKVSRLARWVQSIEIPGTMVYFKSLNARVSVLFTIPIGFATGMLAATIAVGGFIGVPALHYVLGAPSLMASATELVTAFVMGVGGTVKFAWSGLVDIRLAMIILAGSLFGIQLGAIGTTYVKPHMIKVVMGTIMVLVLLSRAIAIPVYLSELELIDKLDSHVAGALKNISFVVLIAALAAGAAIVFAALWRGIGVHRRELTLAAVAPAFAPATVAMPTSPQLSPVGRFERFLVATDGSEFSAGAVREAFHMAQKCGARVRIVSIVSGEAEMESMGEQLLKKEMDAARRHLDQVASQAAEAGVACETQAIQAGEIYQELVHEAEHMQADLIVMGRRGRRGLARLMLGDVTFNVIGHARCSVLVVPRAAELTGQHFVVASDGSRFGDAAAATTGNLAKLCHTPVTVVSVTQPSHSAERREEAQRAVNRIVAFLKKEGIEAQGKVPHGRPDDMIVQAAQRTGADLIVMGSHGRTGLERVLLGSTTERVINLTPSAVLVVKSA